MPRETFPLTWTSAAIAIHAIATSEAIADPRERLGAILWTARDIAAASDDATSERIARDVLAIAWHPEGMPHPHPLSALARIAEATAARPSRLPFNV